MCLQEMLGVNYWCKGGDGGSNDSNHLEMTADITSYDNDTCTKSNNTGAMTGWDKINVHKYHH